MTEEVTRRTIWTLHDPATGRYLAGNHQSPVFCDTEDEGAAIYYSERQVRAALVSYHAIRLVRQEEGSEEPVDVSGHPMKLQFRKVDRVVSSTLLETDTPDVTKEAIYQIRLRHIDSEIYRAVGWMRTRDDYEDWHFAAKMPRWVFEEDDIEGVEKECERIGLPVLASDPVCFFKTAADVTTFRMLFDDIDMIIDLDDASFVLDNRFKDAPE